MTFSPAFALLPRFTSGLQSGAVSGSDVAMVSDYLGVSVEGVSLQGSVEVLNNELLRQNRFLSLELASDSISDSNEYSRSLFIREVVANNRARRSAKAHPAT